MRPPREESYCNSFSHPRWPAVATGTLTEAGVGAGMADTSVTWAQSHPRGVALALVPTAHCPLALAYPLSLVLQSSCGF